jgi:hypothetical protein
MRKLNLVETILEEAEHDPVYVGTERQADGYVLNTVDQRARDLLHHHGITMSVQLAPHRYFTGFVEKLPKIKGVHFYADGVSPPEAAEVKAISAQYSKVRDLMAARDKLGEQVERELDKLNALVVESGIRTKPGAYFDSQVFDAESSTRLHAIETITEAPDLEALAKAAESNEPLREAIQFRINGLTWDQMKLVQQHLKNVEPIPLVVRGALHHALEQVPARIKRRVMTFDTSRYFSQQKIDNADCPHCGGRANKEQTCKRCNLTVITDKRKKRTYA